MIDIDREKVKEAYKEVKSYRKVARMFNVSYMTIQRIVKDVTKSSKVVEIRKLQRENRMHEHDNECLLNAKNKLEQELKLVLKENEKLKNKLNCFKRMQAEVNIKSRKLKKIKEYINPILDDICITCKCFKEMQNCWQCDYEHHRNEISNSHSNYNLANEILKILKEQE